MWRSGLGPAFPRRSGSVLEAPALVAGLEDVAVMGQTVEERGGHLCITEGEPCLAIGPSDNGERAIRRTPGSW